MADDYPEPYCEVCELLRYRIDAYEAHLNSVQERIFSGFPKFDHVECEKLKLEAKTAARELKSNEVKLKNHWEKIHKRSVGEVPGAQRSFPWA